MNDLRKIVRIQLFIIVLFIINKFILRPYVLEQMEVYWLEVFVLSFPNLCEAIIGVIILIGIGLMANDQLITPDNRLSKNRIYFIATAVTGLYVITQEFKLHNIGGRNVYDPFDVAFSVIGLAIGYALIVIMKPRINTNRT